MGTALTPDFLRGIGVDMDDATLQAFSKHFDESLHERVIDRIIHTLSDEQLGELADMRQAGGDRVWQWLQANVPHLGDIIKQEVDAMLADVVRSSDHL
jgi:hypothetical protein